MQFQLTSFLRSFEEDLLLSNLRAGSAAVLNDASDFLRPMLIGKDVETVAHDLAQKYNVPLCDVLRDIRDFYQNLTNLGLVKPVSENRDGIVASANDSHTKGVAVKDDEGQWLVTDFYARHNMLPDLHIDLTDACTERCVHCYVPQGQYDFLPYDLVEKVLREFREQQGLTVQLSGGECMKHPKFDSICRLCRKLDLNFIVLSNLTLCGEKIIEVLKETDPQFVNVSLYSMVPDDHDAITQIRGSWQKTMAAIDACQQAGIHIRLATPLLKANQGAYPALRKFAEERHVHLIPDCEIIPKCNGDCSNLNYACSPEEVEAVLREDKAFWDRGYGRGAIPKPEDKVCDIGKLLCLNSKGEYYPCSGMHGYVLGNARNETLTEVWRGERMNYLHGLKNIDFPKCVGCEHRSFCKVCPAFNFNATGNLFSSIPAKCALAEVKHCVFGGN